MEKFLSCDWGTTAFRLRLVETAAANILAEENDRTGIAGTYSLWKQAGENTDTRLFFYLTIINEHIKVFEKKLAISLNDIPLIISGMASSSIGMIELPYKMLPLAVDGSDANVHTIEATPDFPHTVLIISGARDEDDVMRGEETMLIGAAILSAENSIYIFPGTHSKHIIVNGDKAISVKTYMTGEFFKLLSKKSILSLSVEEGKGLRDPANQQSFAQGVKDSNLTDLLHTSFRVRTNDLFGKLSKEENYYYLSGLLIGTELTALRNKKFVSITLVSNSTISPYYELAFQILGVDNIVNKQNADEAVIRGQMKIYGCLQ